MTPQEATRKLFQAAKAGDKAAALAAIDAGAHVHALNDDCHTPSMCAGYNGHLELAKLLITLEPYSDRTRRDNRVTGIGALAAGILTWVTLGRILPRSIDIPSPNAKPPPHRVSSKHEGNANGPAQRTSAHTGDAADAHKMNLGGWTSRAAQEKGPATNERD